MFAWQESCYYLAGPPQDVWNRNGDCTVLHTRVSELCTRGMRRRFEGEAVWIDILLWGRVAMKALAPARVRASC